MWGRHILLPLLPNLLVAAGRRLSRGRLRGFLRLYMPDLSWVATICGGFALAWGFLRTGLVLGALRGALSPQPLVDRQGAGRDI